MMKRKNIAVRRATEIFPHFLCDVDSVAEQ